ncbi:unnamed protein product [Paramecium primaurelia]|uniref:Sodium/calcium exchanger membrane region domain-containing protein n=1 Tax=Paramecium primaurelia TaxID=5886 RepID=A0A8S1KDA9_PARPR|nr:unnamed protein product [Paramecium primaurelia]
MANTCLYSLIKASDDSCQYAKDNCNDQTIFPFTHYYFCQLDENWVILILIAPFLFFILFNFLARTVDDYLSPAVTFIAEYFKMSQTFAGVTLIAFANGVPDFLCAVLASQDDDGILIAVGSIFGSGLFMTTIIVGAVILLSGVVKAEKVPFMRDILFNGVAIILLMIFAFIGQINHYMAIGFCSLYLLYIIVVLVNENSIKKKQRQDEINSQEEKKEQEEKQLLAKKDQGEEGNQDIQNVDEELKKELAESIPESFKKPFGEMTTISKIKYVYITSLEFVRKVTIPVSNQEKYDKTYAAIHQLVCPIAMIALLGSFSMEIYEIKVWIILEVIGLLLFIYQIIFEIPIIILSMECVVCSIIWCKQVIQVLIDFILLIQTITGVSYSYLGMTFLAFGNSTCDFLVNTKLASIGYGLMAMTGCFSGGVFNMLCGFGGALVRLTAIEKYPGVVSFDLFRDAKSDSQTDIIITRMNNSIAYCVIIFSLMNIIMTCIVVITKKFKLTKNLAYYYFFIYSVFFIFITTLTIALSSIVSYLSEQ